MAWSVSEPTSATRVREADDIIRANFTALDDAVGREHEAMTELSATPGAEFASRIGICAYGALSAMSGYSSVSDGGLIFDTNGWDFYIYDGTAWQRARQIPQNTKAFFYQAAAPIGWTLITSVNDRVLWINDATAGTVGGSWDVTNIDQSSHTHNYTSEIYHRHGFTTYAIWNGTGNYICARGDTGSSTFYTNYTGATPRTTAAASNGSSVSDTTWRPVGRDCILCQKD